jgi:hypothetical protein
LAVDVFLLDCGDTMNKIEKFGLFFIILAVETDKVGHDAKALLIFLAFLIFYVGDYLWNSVLEFDRRNKT